MLGKAPSMAASAERAGAQIAKDRAVLKATPKGGYAAIGTPNRNFNASGNLPKSYK